MDVVEWVGLIAASITIISAVVWGYRMIMQRRAKTNAPEVRLRVDHSATGRVIALEVQMPQGQRDWIIDQVAVKRYVGGKFLSNAVATGRDRLNHPTGFEAISEWRRRLGFGRRSHAARLAVHPDAPDFTMAVSINRVQNPKQRATVDVRCHRR